MVTPLHRKWASTSFALKIHSFNNLESRAILGLARILSLKNSPILLSITASLLLVHGGREKQLWSICGQKGDGWCVENVCMTVNTPRLREEHWKCFVATFTPGTTEQSLIRLCLLWHCDLPLWECSINSQAEKSICCFHLFIDSIARAGGRIYWVPSNQ